MKFRNPETGEVFDVTNGAPGTGFCFGIRCYECPIRSAHPYCKKFINDHFREAARLMGYEVVEDTIKTVPCHEPLTAEQQKDMVEFIDFKLAEKEEANMDKPRICEILGVEVGQSFKLKGADMGFYVDRDGIVKREEDDASIGLPEICLMINHPDRIIRKPRFTEQEVEDAKTIRRILRDDGKLTRSIHGIPTYGCIYLKKEAFPSIRPGQSYTLDEIIGSAK